jgi:hypothetical protein
MATQNPTQLAVSPEQAEALLRSIACTALTMRDLCMGWLCEAGDTEQGTHLHAAQMFAERIGALADSGLKKNCEVFGSAAEWMAGEIMRGDKQ